MTTTNLVLRIANTVLMIGIPILAALWIFRRGKEGFRPIWIGAAAFVLSQVGHIPFNQYLMMPVLESWGIQASAQSGVSLLVLGVAAGLSAGLFEEITRYFVFRTWLKGSPGELLPVKYGIGHGGVEAFLLGLVTLVALTQVLVLSGENALLSFSSEEVALVKSQLEVYWAVPWQHSLLGAWERVSAMAFHIGASLMVYKSVRQKNILWLIIAILGHTGLNAFAVVGIQKLNVVLLEGVLFLFGAGWLFWGWMVREKDPLEKDQEPPLPPPVQLSASQITPEHLEESRYD